MGSVLNLVGNVLWFIFGGFLSGLGWWLASLIMFISIIGIPFGRACFVIGKLAFFPFGKDVIKRNGVKGKKDIGTGLLGLLGNIIWFIFAGWWLFIGEVLEGIVLCITLIGIPFGIQHFKLAGISLSPVGRQVIDKTEAKVIRERNAKKKHNVE